MVNLRLGGGTVDPAARGLGGELRIERRQVDGPGWAARTSEDGPAKWLGSGSETTCVGLALNPAEPEDKVCILRELPLEPFDVFRRLRSRSRSMPSTMSLRVRLRRPVALSDVAPVDGVVTCEDDCDGGCGRGCS